MDKTTSSKGVLKRPLRWLFAFSCVVNVLLLAVPLYTMQVYDRVLSSASIETLIYLTLVTVVALVVYSSADMVRGIIAQRMSADYAAHIAEDLFKSASETSERRDAMRVMRDLNTTQSFLSSRTAVNLLDLPFAPIFILCLFFLHYSLALIALVSIGILIALTIINNKMNAQERHETNVGTSAALSFSLSALRNREDIRAMGLLPMVFERWGRRFASSLSSADRAAVSGSFFQALGKFTRQGSQVVITAWAAYLVLEGFMSGGMLFAASMFAGRALQPIDQVIGAWTTITQARDAYNSLSGRLEHMEPEVRKTTLPATTGNLAFEDVSYGPDGASMSDPFLQNFNFEIEPGKITVLAGRSGGGKSTIARLAAGAIEPGSGVVRLDGFDLRQWPDAQRAASLGYLAQDVVFYPGTIAENIARLELNYDEDKVVAAAQRAGVHDLIATLPKGYETEVGQGQVPLSGGQRQRIALARALYTNPSLLILDEPDAHLDEEGQNRLLVTLGEARDNGAAILAVTQRQAILKIADRIVTIANGSIENDIDAALLRQKSSPTRSRRKQLKRTTSASEADRTKVASA